MSRAARALVLALLAGAVLSAGSAARAVEPSRHTDAGDPNDVNGALDVRLVELHHASPREPVWVIETWGTWTVGRIWDRGFLFVFIDTRWSERAEYYALIRSTGTGVQGLLFRDSVTGDDELVGSLPVWRGDLRSVATKVDLDDLVLGPSRTFYRWSVITTMTSDICPQVCLDAVPNNGSVTQELGEPDGASG